ncbi:Uma2 family endonuclease [Hamadaea tsunoensis]|uniref:Uma2 family endonuclease n=1 Tax=Hamadaea tsunoensis TaxID=53368 RepID=UPI00040555CD|nr:Uma2 family endonuclease [Hamadaea tsunoensis]
MTEQVELAGRVSAGRLTAADMHGILLDVPFEISDGKLEIMTPPSIWHQATARRIENLLEKRYPAAVSDVTTAIGDHGRRPDVVALHLPLEQIIRERISAATPDMIEVVVEVISHDRADKANDAVSVRRDREIKFHEYAAAGIPEYWIVDEVADDAMDASVEVYHLRGGTYVPAVVVRLSDVLSGVVEIPGRP